MANPSHPRYTVEQVCAALRETRGLVTPAAKRLSCEPQTIYNYAKRHAAVRQVMDEQRERLVDSAELRLIEAVEQKGEPWAIGMVLKTLGKKRGYVERIEQTGADGAPMEHRIGPSLNLDDATDEELAVVQRLADRSRQRAETPGLPPPSD